MKTLFITIICLICVTFEAAAQEMSPTPAPEKKINQRPETTPAEPFDQASIEVMGKQCVRLETGVGIIDIELFPESAPETVRNFLNLVAGKIYDSTKFTRVVPDFVVQGGNIGSREIKTFEMLQRARRTIPDEPNLIKHERGIVSMARPDTPNGATSHFFILVGESRHLDGTFAAFGRVTSGMEFVEKMNKMPVEGDKPVNPVSLNRALIIKCQDQSKDQAASAFPENKRFINVLMKRTIRHED